MAGPPRSAPHRLHLANAVYVAAVPRRAGLSPWRGCILQRRRAVIREQVPPLRAQGTAADTGRASGVGLVRKRPPIPQGARQGVAGLCPDRNSISAAESWQARGVDTAADKRDAREWQEHPVRGNTEAPVRPQKRNGSVAERDQLGI